MFQAIRIRYLKWQKDRADYRAFCDKWLAEIEREEARRHYARTGRYPTPELTSAMIKARKRYYASEAYQRRFEDKDYQQQRDAIDSKLLAHLTNARI